ncbi:MAG: SDR family oxidoreductase [Pseudomonadota bacterium]|nr:SDR family oxidoreductase [Pseudomonadota bacterium]
MTIRFDGRVAIVTGAGNGLGRSHALELARRGARVVVNDFGGARDGTGGSLSPAEQVVEEIRALRGEAIADGANVADADQCRLMAAEAMRKWGRIDILVNNAGILRDKSFQKMTDADWNSVIDVHLNGAANCTRAVWPHMREQNYGRVVMTTSTSGLYGNFGQANYGAAKMGLVGLMSTLVIEGAKYGIHVNCLAPTAATRMTEDILSPEMLDMLKPEYVTPAAIFLASEDAPNRTVMLAGAGHFATLELRESKGMHLSEQDRHADAIAQHFQAIADMDGADRFSEGREHVTKILTAETAMRQP